LNHLIQNNFVIKFTFIDKLVPRDLLGNELKSVSAKF